MKIKLIFTLLIGLAVAGCSSLKNPEDFNGKWRPINSFDKTIKVMPLGGEYYYGVLEFDLTLQGLVSRWASDTGVPIEIKCVNDFSIPSKLLQMQVNNINAALYEINSIYKDYRVDVKLDERKAKLLFVCDANKNSIKYEDRKEAAPL